MTLVDTGVDSNTGGRLKRILDYVQEDPFFHLTYGDGLADVDIMALQRFHTSHKKLATVTAVSPPGRFGSLELADDASVSHFVEKPSSKINGGFFVLSPEVINNTITDDYSVWEADSLPLLAKINQLAAFIHEGFWHPMDTLRDKYYLEELWSSGSPPWKTW